MRKPKVRVRYRYWTPKRPKRKTNEARAETGFINLVLLIILGVAVSYWLMWYTEWFEHFASILALSGGLTWVAVVLKLLTEDQKKNLQNFAQSALGRGSSGWLLAIVITGLVLLASCFCTIRVKLMQDTSDRIVLIYPATEPAKQDRARRLSPGNELRDPEWTGLFAGRDLFVKVNGYPTKRVRVRSWGIEALQVPFSFRVPTVLVRSSPDLALRLKNNPSELDIIRGSGKGSVPGYTGQAVWIGCDEDVEVPAAIQQRWRDTLPEVNRVLMDQWLPPNSVPFDSPLEVREIVTMSIPGIVKPIAITIREPQPPNYFPQEVQLDATASTQ